MEIALKKVAESAKISSQDLLTRPVGKALFQEMGKRLARISPGEVLILDGEGIQVMDLSFVDECIVPLIRLSRQDGKPFYIKCKNLSSISEINIDSVFESYRNYSDEKLVLVCESLCYNNRFYLGTLEPLEEDIIEYLRINATLTIEDLVRYTGRPAEEMSRLVRGLNDTGALRFDGERARAL